jgi:hypothetical protein
MKKLTIILLATLSLPTFAQKNDLVFTTAVINYNGSSSYEPVSGLNKIGGQLGLYYYRNIKWLQIGGGIELGKTFSKEILWSETPNVQAYQHKKVADPFWMAGMLVNYRHAMHSHWFFHIGPSVGYMSAATGVRYRVEGTHASSVASNYQNRDATLNGWYAGGQFGITRNVGRRLALSAEFQLRFAQLAQEKPVYPHYSGSNGYHMKQLYPVYTGYDKVNMQNFGLGVHYRF